jgi:hypothetical protein
MLFVEWWLISRVCLLSFLGLLPVFGFWFVRNKRPLIRIPIRILSGLVAVWAVISWLFVLVMPWPHIYSAPLYSPNGKMAVRIDDYNASGFGGADN